MSNANPVDPLGRSAIIVRGDAREFDAFFPPSTIAQLRDLGRLEIVQRDDLQPPRLERTVGTARVLVVDWDFPPLDDRVLAAAPRLELVAHTGSAVGSIVTGAVWKRGIRVTQAGAAMSRAVAELSLTFTLSLLRQLPHQDHALHEGQEWSLARSRRPGQILGARIGVVGAGRIGRAYIDLVRALGADVRVHDPYLMPDDPLSQSLFDLERLLAWCDVLVLHAPSSPLTRGLIGDAELEMMRDGAAIVNTARSSLIDDDALYAQVSSGRLDVALDVYPQEPLPVDSRWRAVPNALLSPHLGGATEVSRVHAGRIVVDEIRRYISGEPLEHEVTAPDLGRIA